MDARVVSPTNGVTRANEDEANAMTASPRPLGLTASELKTLFREEREKRRERRQLVSVMVNAERLTDELAAFEETVLQLLLDNNRKITEQLLAAGIINAEHLPVS